MSHPGEEQSKVPEFHVFGTIALPHRPTVLWTTTCWTATGCAAAMGCIPTFVPAAARTGSLLAS